MFSGRISNCYDSHVHLAATGEVPHQLNLRDLKSPRDVASLKIDDSHYKSDWLIGFGWDQSQWSEGPHRSWLDQAFGSTPAVFSRVDGHVYWVNSEVLKRAGWLDAEGKLKISVPHVEGGEILVDANGVPTGVLVDAAKNFVEPLIPKTTSTEMQSYLLSGMREFHKNGFSHIRDMSCSELQWNELLKLEASGLLTLAIEQTFSAETPDEFDSALALAKRALQVRLNKVRPHAMKVYYDGALGSNGAWLSQPYQHLKDSDYCGFRLTDKKGMQEFMRRSWELPLPIAVHTIGDQAAHEVVEAAVELWDKGFEGQLFLEHAEVLRTDTIQLMKGRPVQCYIQPCHWLSDRQWLKEKLGSLVKHVFPWRALEEAKIPFYFGSDSPISPPSLKDNWEALRLSPEWGVPSLREKPELYHTHPDVTWIPNTYTTFANGEVVNVYFNGSLVYDGTGVV